LNLTGASRTTFTASKTTSPSHPQPLNAWPGDTPFDDLDDEEFDDDVPEPDM
jgi:hypothetical protein